MPKLSYILLALILLSYGCRETPVPEPVSPQVAGPAPQNQAEVVEPSKNSLAMAFVQIPAGSYQLTIYPPGYENQNGEGLQDELSHQELKFDTFSMGITEVTREQWQKVMGPSEKAPDEDGGLPKTNISWREVHQFIEKLNELEGGTHYRLPTDGEWLYAAFNGGSGCDEEGNQGTLDESAPQNLHPAGRGKPNSRGLFDLHGNAWEWCQDWDGNIADLAEGEFCWGFNGRRCLKGPPQPLKPDFRNINLGFRLVKI